MKLLGLSLIAWYFLLSSPMPVQAQSVAYSTEFQPDTLDDWQLVFNQQHQDPNLPCRGPEGNSTWSLTEPGFGVDIKQSVPCRMVILAPLEASLGRSISIQSEWLFPTHQQDQNLLLSWVDDKNFISLHIFNNKVHLEQIQNGESLGRDTVPFGFKPQTLYKTRIDFSWETRQLRFWANHVLILETKLLGNEEMALVPGLYASVGDTSQSSNSRWKSFHVTDTFPFPNLPGWKQVESSWSEFEYDSASSWTTEPSTLARWGCALTSAVNVLSSYGITQLPTGEPLDPGTMNTWLKSEADGFIGPGLLNWRAITRLAKWHSQEYNTPALEFSVHTPAPDKKASWLQEQLDRQRPVILEQPGHFVTAWQKTNSGEVKIHDPGYSRTTLAEYDNNYLSARLFTPSFTDLQGGVLLLPPWAEVHLTRVDNGQPIPLQPLEPLWDSTLFPGWKAWDVPRWGAGAIRFTNVGTTLAPITGWFYDTEGNPQELSVGLRPSSTVITTTGQPPTSDPVTDKDFATWLSWSEIQSPVIWEWHRATEQVLLQASENTTQKDSLRKHYRWLLERSTAQGWVSTGFIDFLMRDLERY